MQKHFFFPFLCFFFSFQLFAQLSENFSDGNFTQNPVWQGDTEFFRITEDHKLQSSGPNATSVIYLSVPHTGIGHTTWEFSVAMNFAPSNSNYVRIYLASTQANLKSSLDGYYIRIGESGDTDGVDLYRQRGTTSTKIIDGIARRATTNPNLKIRVRRDAAGNWQLFSQKTDEPDFVTEGTATDNTVTTSTYFGVVCYHTATNRQGFTFDDFTIASAATPTPPSVQPSGYRELIITELLADESPRVELPQAEFVELYNSTNRVINLKNYTFSDPSTRATLPDYNLPAQTYVILCRTTNIANFEPFGRVIGLSSFPSLNNSDDELTLRNPADQLIDYVHYDISWYKDRVKADGGWTLEQIDLTNPCGEENNWTASVADAGGTPGKANSVAASKPDLTPPAVLLTEVVSPVQLQLSFNEKLDSLSATDLLRYSVEPAVKIVSAQSQKPAYRTVLLSLQDNLRPKTVYTISVQGLKDCNGNIIATPQRVTIGLPEPADSLDVVINEVLFNPRVGGVDFVEIYNRSDKYISLKDWQLANVQNEIVANRKTVTTANRLLSPGGYAVFTTNASLLTTHYPKARPETFVIMSSMPTYYDDAGTVVLLNGRGKVIDRFDYSEKYHFTMIAKREGVSLERLDVHTATNLPDNWHSAAATEGYATPGYRNSQVVESVAATASFSIEPKVITPNEDGYHDFTMLQYRFASSGNMATVTIFDLTGRTIKQIALNQSLSTEGFFTWDGSTQTGEKVRSGRYIVAFAVFNPNGQQQMFKADVVVSW